MARTDAVQFFLELAAEWRRLGAEVTFEPGWERRGNGTSPAYEGGIVHHTGFVSSFANPFPAKGTLLNGRPDLSGPLCNVAGPVCPVDRPRLHIIAAFPANHAGASGGRSMGPLPKSSLFNRLVVGLEIDYAGLTSMIGGQYRAGLIFARGLANVLRRSVEYIRAHAETSVTGKWDIGVGDGKAHTYDMAAFRRDTAFQGDNDMDANQDRMLREVHDELFKRLPNRVDGKSGDTILGYSANADAQAYHIRTTDVPNVLAQIAGLTAAVNALAAGAAGDGVNPEELRAVIREEMANVVDVQVTVRDGDPNTGPTS